VDEAETLYCHVLCERREKLGSDHTDTLECLEGLVGVLHSQGKLAEAEGSCRQLLAGRESKFGRKAPEVVACEDKLADILEEKFRKAAACMVKGPEADVEPLPAKRVGSTRTFVKVDPLPAASSAASISDWEVISDETSGRVPSFSEVAAPVPAATVTSPWVAEEGNEASSTAYAPPPALPPAPVDPPKRTHPRPPARRDPTCWAALVFRICGKG